MRAEQNGLKGQPFRHEAVERRQRRDRDAADEEHEGGLRHAVNEAAELFHVALAGGIEHRAGAEEQQTLEQRMIEHVQQPGSERQRRRHHQALRLERERKAERGENDADVLDGAVGEHALDVVLHQRVEHAHHRGDAADGEHEHAPPPVRRAEQIEHDADEAVDRDLGHHTAHQGGDVAGRRGMSERQPAVQRHHARLRAGAEQHEDKHRRRRRRGWMGSADGIKYVVAVSAGQQAEGKQQRQRAEARHDEIDIAGAQVVALLVMGDHQRPRGQRHELPRHQKAEGVVGEHHQIHGGEIGGIERQDALRGFLMAAIAERVEAGSSAAEIDDDQEKRRQRIDAEMRAEPRQPQRQCDGGNRLPKQAHEPDGTEREGDYKARAIGQACRLA